ncbi:ubiquinone anaerobic biosynthesis accessory factor UbiT [Marinospirillum insulare]|uniref:Ubiquinone biosynthesis accessory factor UbiT n=1 Tax=Marinospirillum insulare TaxID=217169 RepID=A0ABQ5ZV32_9GAMM|nr:SCP2 sterol-binding domain-containing protein [Marinospirillum insulare]GLR64014.1 SCP2 domain-containing protein [Marinospirillum insulare]
MFPPSLPVRFHKLLVASKLLAKLNTHLPLWVKKSLVETRLNQLFAEALKEDEFELLAGRYLSLKITDLGVEVTLTLKDQCLELSDQPAETVILGNWPAFVQLALRKEDPDGLFFRRLLLIEGDTELGLGVKNLLDSLDWSLDKGWLGSALNRMAVIN